MARVKLEVINLGNNPLPKYATPGSSGMDLRADLPNGSIVLNPGEIKLIPTGIKMNIPVGYEIQLRARSGLSCKGITLANGLGTVDCLTGDTKIPLLNGTEDTLKNIVERVINGEEIYVYSINDENGNLAPGLITHAVYKGKRKVIKVEFDNGTTLKGTENHEVRTYEGSYIKLKDLKIGDSVSPLNRFYDKDGYELFSCLRYDMIGKIIRVHRAVYNEYYRPDSPPEVVHHIDENPRNNYPSNLQGLTSKEHYYAHKSHAKMHEWNKTEEGQRHAKGFGSRMARDERRLSALRNNPNMKGIPGYKFTDEQRYNSSVSAKKSWENPSEKRIEAVKRNISIASKVGHENFAKKGLDVVREILHEGTEVTKSSYEAKKEEIKLRDSINRLPKWGCLMKYYESIENIIKSSVNHKVSKITELDEPEDVYDITIDKFHNFLAEDIFVHNCDFHDEVKVILINLGSEPFTVNNNDRIAQAVLMKYERAEVELVESFESDIEDRGGGFGHTGIN